MLNYDGDNPVQSAVSPHQPPDAKFPFQILVNVSSVVRINNAEICNQKTIPRLRRILYNCNVTFQYNVVIDSLSLSPPLLSVQAEMMTVVYKQRSSGL